jgi:translation initiation factor IF-2
VECGLGVSGFSDWREGDLVNCYQLVTKARRLEEARATTVVDLANMAAAASS